MSQRFDGAIEIFRSHGGILRMSEALRAGISRRTLYAMRDECVLELLSRGVYRLSSMEGLAQQDLVAVTTRVPHGVICLISALSFHELTTQVPHAVDVAVIRGSERPRIDYPPVNTYWFSGEAFAEGIETPTVDGRKIRVYGPEKSIADIFKYRNKLGSDVALESLRSWCERRASSIDNLLHYARICRVERVLMPYLEAMT